MAPQPPILPPGKLIISCAEHSQMSETKIEWKMLIFNDSDYFVGFYSEGWRNLGRIACRDDICDVVVIFAQLPLERFVGEFGCEIFVQEFIMNYVGTTKMWKG